MLRSNRQSIAHAAPSATRTSRRPARPEDYRWSSVHANLGSRFDSLVTPHACLIALGADASSRRSAYSEWLRAGDDEEQLRTIRAHLAQQRVYGDPRFQAMIERTLNRPASVRPRGRPARDQEKGTEVINPS